MVLAARLPAVDVPGDCHAEFAVQTEDEQSADIRVPLIVTGASQSSPMDDAALAELANRLTAAEALVELPAGYEDVSEGALANWKHAIKRKLLKQFQTAYVDVLSRQQSALNQVLLGAIQELTESIALLSQRLDALELRRQGDKETRRQ